MMTSSLPLGEADERAGAAVELERVTRLYGNFAALREVSLRIEAGGSVVLLGENGAGKSTILRLVAGLAAPSYGSVRVFGERPEEQRGRIGTMSHATLLYDELTGEENLVYFGQLYGLGADAERLRDVARAALAEVGLTAAAEKRVGAYSQGMRQRAALARVLMTKPDVLLLDEPFSNLDVASVKNMVERLLQFAAEPGSDGCARTLLLTTHQAELARPLAKSTVTLRAGRVVSVEQA